MHDNQVGNHKCSFGRTILGDKDQNRLRFEECEGGREGKGKRVKNAKRERLPGEGDGGGGRGGAEGEAINGGGGGKRACLGKRRRGARSRPGACGSRRRAYPR